MVGNIIGLGNRPPLIEAAAGLRSLAIVLVFTTELEEGEEDGVAAVALVLGLETGELFVDVDEPLPSPPPPKTNPKSMASSGGDTLALNVGEPGGVVDVVCASGVRGEWKWMCGWGRPVDLVVWEVSVWEEVEELPGLLPAIADAWFKPNDRTFVFNTIPIVCPKGPNRGEVGAVNAEVASACVVLESLFSRDNNSLAFALVVLVVLGISMLCGNGDDRSSFEFKP